MNKDIVLVSVPKLDPSTPIAGPAVLKSQLERHGFSCVYMDMNVYLFNNMKDGKNCNDQGCKIDVKKN